MKIVQIAALSCIVLTKSVPAMAQSGTIDGNFVGCVTKNALSEFIAAANANDNRQMQALIGNLCININGLEYSVISQGLANAEVRVYNGADSIKLFTVSEALR